MRRSLLGLVLVALTSSFALAASTDQLAATPHNFQNPPAGANNFSAKVGNATGTICQPCHTPHHAMVDEAISDRLWNHALSTTGYTLYGDEAGGAYNGNAEGSQGMDRVSRLCLGCHDGTVALDAYGSYANGYTRTGNAANRFAANDVANLGTDFRDDHPVGITAMALLPSGAAPANSHLKAATLTYNRTMNDPSGALNPDGTPVQVPDPSSGVKSAKIGSLSLTFMPTEGFVVGCKTCHNPHGSGTTNLTPYPHLLAMAPAGLCNNCHYK